MAPDAATSSLTLDTADGLALEAELIEPPAPVAVAVVCHPHPAYGGTMHNHVVGELVRALARRGSAALRFNFRGTGRSEGEHDGGREEVADVQAAVDEVAGRFPDRPLILAGYSFGADVALTIADRRVAAWLAVAPPLRVADAADMAAGPDPRPIVIVTGAEDEFRPPEQVRALTEAWASCQVIDVPGTGHFLTTGLDAVAAAAEGLLDRLVAS